MTNHKRQYIYCPYFGKTKEENLEWMNNEFAALSKEKYQFIRNIWWKLIKYSIINQVRDKDWFKENLPHLRAIWNNIVEYRELGIEKLEEDINLRKNNSNSSKQQSIESSDYIPPMCIGISEN